MSNNIRVKINSDEARRILRSPAVERELLRHAERVRVRADQRSTDVLVSKQRRDRVGVIVTSFHTSAKSRQKLRRAARR